MKSSFLGKEKTLENARRRRALHTVMGNDLYTMMLKSRIRMQKLLNEMNGWSVRPDPSDERRLEVLTAAMAALSEIQDIPAASPEPSSPQPFLEAAEQQLAAQHAQKMAEWRATLEEQHRRTALLSGSDAAALRKSGGTAQSPAEALDRALADRRRLRDRTQLSRSGKRPPDVEMAAAAEEKSAPFEANSDEAIIWAAEQERLRKKKGDKVVCCEVYDDSDFYEQLLHEFIRSRGGDVETASDSKKWADLQQLRSKLKIVANERASKGRKIRYTIYPKMVNISAPKVALVPPSNLDCRIMSDKERENLYRSLFR